MNGGHAGEGFRTRRAGARGLGSLGSLHESCQHVHSAGYRPAARTRGSPCYWRGSRPRRASGLDRDPPAFPSGRRRRLRARSVPGSGPEPLAGAHGLPCAIRRRAGLARVPVCFGQRDHRGGPFWFCSCVAGFQDRPECRSAGSLDGMGQRALALRDLLVVVQVALCFVLVSASFLALQGLQQALEMNLGFRPQQVATAAFELNLAGYTPERGRAFQQQALQAIQQLPGVQSAAYSNSVPLSIDQSHTGVFPADKTDLQPSDRIGVAFYQVSPGFFATMGTKLLAGREFTWHDDTKSPQVAIVNLAFARRILHNPDAVGKHFRGGVLGPFAEVIGVVEDGKYESLTESPEPVVFWSILQSYNSTTTVEVKSALPATQMVAEIRQAIARLDPELPLYGVGSLEQMLGFAFFPTRAAAIALSAFGILAIMLATTGIHGLVAYAVSRRTHEIGIRMAIGARPGEVLRLVLGKTAALLVLGSLVGLTLALAVGQAISSVVYEMQPRDPLVILSAWIAIALLGLFASWSPARRAMRVDPLVALRYE